MHPDNSKNAAGSVCHTGDQIKLAANMDLSKRLALVVVLLLNEEEKKVHQMWRF